MKSVVHRPVAPAKTGYGQRVAPATPQPHLEATLALLAGLLLTGWLVHGETPAGFVRFAAIGVGLSLVLSMAVEFRHAWTNLLRADLVALVALYFLLFFEFLFPQPHLNELITDQQEIEKGVYICLWAFGALAVGRHLIAGLSLRHWRIVGLSAPPSAMLWLFWGCFALGYLYMLATVDFNPVAMVGYFLEPRFSVPWGREQLGDWKAMLYETGSVLYLVPSLAGVILGRRRHFTATQAALVGLGLLFTLFYGFTTGTRNIIGSFLITFLVSFFYASGARLTKTVIVSCLLSAGLMMLSVIHGIEFRTVGFKNYLGGARPSSAEEEKSLFVDYNIYVVSRLATVFPRERDYLGMTVPAWLLARPVPRVLWPGKPDGTQISIEGALGEEGLTLSSTFVGEAYMSAGLFGVIIAALGFGCLAQWWTRKAYTVDSDFGILIYASGFFSVVISMRSMYMLPVAMLPTLVVCVVGVWFLRRGTGDRQTTRLRTTGPQDHRQQDHRTAGPRTTRPREHERLHED